MIFVDWEATSSLVEDMFFVANLTRGLLDLSSTALIFLVLFLSIDFLGGRTKQITTVATKQRPKKPAVTTATSNHLYYGTKLHLKGLFKYYVDKKG